MSLVAKKERYYTYKDYYAWDDDCRWELIDGVPYAMAPAPSLGHQSILVELARQLGTFLQGKRCKLFIAPCDVRLNADAEDDTVVQPDLLVVCDKSKLEDGKSVVGVPDLIIEILSPSNTKHDKLTKLNLYKRFGVPEYWIVDPDTATVTVNTLWQETGYSSQVYDKRSTAVPVEVLDGCTIDLANVFDAV